MSKTFFKLICITLSSQNMKSNTVTALDAAVHITSQHWLVAGGSNLHCSLLYVSNMKIQQNSQA